MSKKNITIIVSVAFIILAVVGYWLFGPIPLHREQEQEKQEENLGNGASVLLAALEQETDINFSEVAELEFNWNVPAEGKVDTKVILGRSFQVDGVSEQEQARIESFFYDKGFEINLYNAAAGTMSGAVGYKKDNLVCIISSQIWLDENGLPLEDYKRDIQVKCGENDYSTQMPIAPSGDKERIDIKTGENFTIVLEANPTTGYEWQVELDAEYLELVSQDYVVDSEELVGSGGHETFVFQPLKSGETELKLSYLRSWEDEAIEEKVYQIIVE